MQSWLALNRFAAEICRRKKKHLFMAKKFIHLVAIALMGGSATIFAQEGTKPANVGEGTLSPAGLSNYFPERIRKWDELC
jgi:hypothetical protein